MINHIVTNSKIIQRICLKHQVYFLYRYALYCGIIKQEKIIQKNVHRIEIKNDSLYINLYKTMYYPINLRYIIYQMK